MAKNNNRRRWLAPVVLGLVTPLLVASPGHPMQERQGKKGGGGGGGDGDIPVMMVLRDAGTDLLQSDDGTAYANGVDAIEALLKATGGRDPLRYFRIVFPAATQKGKREIPGTSRKVFLNLGAGWTGNTKPQSMMLMADDCLGENVAGGLSAVTPANPTACARFILYHVDFDVNWSWQGWLHTHLQGMREVECVGGASGTLPCDAWTFGPHPDNNGNGDADVTFDVGGLQRLPVPFAAAICVMSEYTAAECAAKLPGF